MSKLSKNWREDGGATIEIKCDRHPNIDFKLKKVRNEWLLTCPLCNKILFKLKGYKPGYASFRNHIYWEGKWKL